MDKEIIEVESLSKFIEVIKETNDEEIHNSPIQYEKLLYRGQPSEWYSLLPRLGRNQPTAASISLFTEERNLIEMAKFQMPDVFPETLQPVELLAKLQHYGIPTRLLDITENPLVALYFACIGKKADEANGEVIVFKNSEHDITNYPIINAIADSYRFSFGTVHYIKLFYDDVIQQPYFLEQKKTVELLHGTDKAAIEWVKECCAKVQFIHAPIRTARQRAQQGRYILFPNTIEDDFFLTELSPIEKDDSCIVKRIIIKAGQKNSILHQLELVGISKKTLFPDNIDIQCKCITEMMEEKSKTY